MFGIGLNGTINEAADMMSKATKYAAQETAAATRAKGEMIKEGLECVAKSNDGIADSNRNITIPVSEWNKIQNEIESMKNKLDFLKRTMPIILHNYALLFHMKGILLDDNDLKGLLEYAVDNHLCYAILYRFLSYAPRLTDRQQIKEVPELTDEDVKVCQYLYQYKINREYIGQEELNLRGLIGMSYKDWIDIC